MNLQNMLYERSQSYIPWCHLPKMFRIGKSIDKKSISVCLGLGSDYWVQGFFLGWCKYSKIVVMTVQLCECTEGYWVIFYKWVKCMVKELCLNTFGSKKKWWDNQGNMKIVIILAITVELHGSTYARIVFGKYIQYYMIWGWLNPWSWKLGFGGPTMGIWCLLQVLEPTPTDLQGWLDC